MTLKQDLIDRIRNEKTKFDMTQFTEPRHVRANCKTARCMAGWIVALRQATARRLVKQLDIRPHDTDTLAAAVWREETGKPCPLDFFAFHFMPLDPEDRLSRITRQDAIKHIQGRHPDWPQR